ncbi:MAG: ATP-binding protein [Janthinobacterium lividum]
MKQVSDIKEFFLKFQPKILLILTFFILISSFFLIAYQNHWFYQLIIIFWTFLSLSFLALLSKRTDHRGKVISLTHAEIPYMITLGNGVPVFVHDTFLTYFPQADTHSLDQITSDFFLKKPLTFDQDSDQDVVTYVVYHQNRLKIHAILKRFPLEDQQWLWTIDETNGQYRQQLDSIYLHSPFLKKFQIKEIFDLAPAGIVFLDAEGYVQLCNSTFIRDFMNDQKIELGDLFIDLLEADNRTAFNQAFQSFLRNEKTTQTVELKFNLSPDSPAIAYIGALKSMGAEEDDSVVQGAALYIFNNREQQQLQLHLIQSQKLQALGQLAGGIAHDFNNLLTAMIGFCDLILLRHSPGDQTFTDLMQIKQNANRAANLVRQLLAFSRQQTLQPKVLNIVDSLANLSLLLQRLVGPSIKLKMLHGRDLGLVKVDQGQFEQVIINLVVNARDAMDEQGEITIKTSNKVIKSAHQIAHELISPGSYILIDVIDIGHGISKEYLPRIFDPFFSTKEIGSGTGLGLSTVYGIVKQTGGHVIVESEPAKGTKFSIYLPRYQGTENLSDGTETPVPETKDLTGQGTILLVEDEDAVRIFSARALRDKGYRVVEADCGEEALAQIKYLQNHRETLNLVITDVVMPQMDGPTLVKKIYEILPNIDVIYMSGYAEDSFRRQLDQEQDIHFLAKPFSLKALAIKVKEVLEQK